METLEFSEEEISMLLYAINTKIKNIQYHMDSLTFETDKAFLKKNIDKYTELSHKIVGHKS